MILQIGQRCVLGTKIPYEECKLAPFSPRSHSFEFKLAAYTVKMHADLIPPPFFQDWIGGKTRLHCGDKGLFTVRSGLI